MLLGWSSREAILGPHQQIVTVNGLFRPFALVAGRAAGMWAWSDRQVTLEPFTDLPREVMAALATEAHDVRRFLGASADTAYKSSCSAQSDARTLKLAQAPRTAGRRAVIRVLDNHSAVPI